MYFLCVYPTCEHLVTRMNKDEKTVRKWIWKYVDMIASLELVCCKWEIRCKFSRFRSNKTKMNIQQQMRELRHRLDDIAEMLHPDHEHNAQLLEYMEPITVDAPLNDDDESYSILDKDSLGE